MEPLDCKDLIHVWLFVALPRPLVPIRHPDPAGVTD